MSDRKRERHKVGKYLLKLVYWTIKIMKDTDYRIMRPFVLCKRVSCGQQKVNTKYLFKYLLDHIFFAGRKSSLLTFSMPWLVIMMTWQSSSSCFFLRCPDTEPWQNIPCNLPKVSSNVNLSTIEPVLTSHAPVFLISFPWKINK